MLPYLLLGALAKETPVYVPAPRRLGPEVAIRGFAGGGRTARANSAFDRFLTVFKPAGIGLLSHIFGMGGLLPNLPQTVGDAIGAWRAFGGNPVPPVQSLDYVLNGFRQDRYYYALDGTILVIRIGLFSSFNDQVTSEEFRGYWQNYLDGRIFWGTGTRVRFRITRTTILFYRSPYRAFGDLAKPSIIPNWDSRKDDIVYEVFGNPDLKLVPERAFKGDKLPPLESQILGKCHRLLKDEVLGNEEMVEPIYIETTAKQGDKLVQP